MYHTLVGCAPVTYGQLCININIRTVNRASQGPVPNIDKDQGTIKSDLQVPEAESPVKGSRLHYYILLLDRRGLEPGQNKSSVSTNRIPS